MSIGFTPPDRLSFQLSRHIDTGLLGEVPEWSNGAVSKTVVLSRVPRVRIPVSPPVFGRINAPPARV